MLRATRKEELLDQLASLKIAVPPRSAGRTTQDCERWIICRWLAAVAAADQLAYPLNLTHRDRPDFALATPSGMTGVEVSEVISEDLAQAYALVERESVDGCIELSRFRPGAQHMERKALRQLIAATTPSGPGWTGDEMEQDWVAFVTNSYHGKRRKAQNPDFTWYATNVLVLYDNSPCLGLKEDAGMRLLMTRLAEVLPEARNYAQLDIVRPKHLLRAASSKEWSRAAIPALWGQSS